MKTSEKAIKNEVIGSHGRPGRPLFLISYKDFHQKYDMTGLAVFCFISTFTMKTNEKPIQNDVLGSHWRPGRQPPESNKLSPDFFVDDPLNKLYVNFQFWRPGCPWAHLGSAGLIWARLGSSGLTWAFFL